ncbi:MAG: hypothetical protein R3286_13855 [Gammaproteobacteria bacterium]|nr:hypothetical protein [Gammaproteobacteria bacterium]
MQAQLTDLLGYRSPRVALAWLPPGIGHNPEFPELERPLGVPIRVNPTLVIGTHDIKPTPSGQMIIDVVNGKMPIYIDGGLNIVDVDDVSRGHILAAQKGRVGERYLLGGRRDGERGAHRKDDGVVRLFESSERAGSAAGADRGDHHQGPRVVQSERLFVVKSS